MNVRTRIEALEVKRQARAVTLEPPALWGAVDAALLAALPDDHVRRELSPCGKHYALKFDKGWQSHYLKVEGLVTRFAECATTEADRGVLAQLPSGAEPYLRVKASAFRILAGLRRLPAMDVTQEA